MATLSKKIRKRLLPVEVPKSLISREDILGREPQEPIEAPQAPRAPLVIPKPRQEAIPATKGGIPKIEFIGDNVIQTLATGEKAEFTKAQWNAKQGQQAASSAGASFLPTPEQAQLGKVEQEISRRAQAARSQGKPIDYNQIFQEMTQEKEFVDLLNNITSFAEAEAAKPLEPFVENPINIGQAAGFGATGALAGLPTGAAAGALAGLAGGPAAPVTVPAGAVAGAAIGLLGGIVSSLEFQRGENIAGATEQVDRSFRDARDLFNLANMNRGELNRYDLVAAFEKQFRDIESAESYLKEKRETGIFSRTKVTKELKRIEEWKQDKAPFLRVQFYSAIRSSTPNSLDSSFINQLTEQQNEKTESS